MSPSEWKPARVMNYRYMKSKDHARRDRRAGAREVEEGDFQKGRDLLLFLKTIKFSF